MTTTESYTVARIGHSHTAHLRIEGTDLTVCRPNGPMHLTDMDPERTSISCKACLKWVATNATPLTKSLVARHQTEALIRAEREAIVPEALDSNDKEEEPRNITPGHEATIAAPDTFGEDDPHKENQNMTTTKNVTPKRGKKATKKAAPKAPKMTRDDKVALVIKESRKSEDGKWAAGQWRIVDKGIGSAFGAVRELETNWTDGRNLSANVYDGLSINEVASRVLSDDSKQRISQMVNAARNARLIGDLAESLSMRAYASFGANVTKEQMVTVIERLMAEGRPLTVANIRREVSGRVTSSSARSNPALALAKAVQAGADISKADLLNALASVAQYTGLTGKEMSDAILGGLNAR